MTAGKYTSQPQNMKLMTKVILVIVALLVVYFLYGRFFASAPQMPAFPPPAVTVQEIQPEDMPLVYEYAGRTTGSREVEIRARVSGILEKRAYEEGSWVEQGQLLFKIDPRPFQASLDQAQARLNQSLNDWKRAQALTKQNAISAREYDAARSAYQQASAEAQTARINLGYTTVTAPVSGVTSKESLSEGSLVTADTSLLTRLTQYDPIYVEFAYPDTDAIAQKRMMAAGKVEKANDSPLTAEMNFGDGSSYSVRGTVDFTDSIIDPDTGTVRARALFPNKEKIVLPGQFVRLKITGLVQKNAVVIPDQAVMQGPQGAFVYLLGKENKAGIQPVVLGEANGEKRIILQGLKDGDKVIVEGMIKVRSDSPVSIVPPAEAAQANPSAQPQHAK